MPSTLLLRLRAPMMSFGDSSRFGTRTTRMEPTKSAIVGLLCCALGRPRGQSVADLSSLRMVVRVDQEGKLLSDYQVTGDIIVSSGNGYSTTVSDRHYLADADFLVGLEGDEALVRHLDAALQTPVWQMSAGRKAFCFSRPVRAGVAESTVERAIAQARRRGIAKALRVVQEVPSSLDVRRDVPLNFEQRLFGSRCVQTFYLEDKGT